MHMNRANQSSNVRVRYMLCLPTVQVCRLCASSMPPLPVRLSDRVRVDRYPIQLDLRRGPVLWCDGYLLHRIQSRVCTVDDPAYQRHKSRPAG